MVDPSSSDWSWFDFFLTHSDETDAIQAALVGNAESFKLDEARTMVSIGPGSGTLDADVIKKCCSKLEMYIGVEPNKNMFDSLSATMNGLQGIQVSLVNDTVPDWIGPKDPVDIVLVSHVMYFVKEPIDCIQQFYKWLKPGGSIIFVHAYLFDLFIQVAEENDVPWPGEYCIPELKRDLSEAGFHKFEEVNFKVHFPVPYENEEFVRGYFKVWFGDVPEDKMQRIIKAFAERWQGTESVYEFTETCIKLTKPLSI